MSQSPGICIDFPSYARADGSASFGFGSGPQASSSLSGPIEVHPSLESPLKAHLESHVVPLSGIPGIHEKKLGQVIENVMKQSLMLEKCPRTLVQIVVQALADSEGNTNRHKGKGKENEDVILASMINSGTLAALNSGSVPMRGVVCAVAVSLNDDGQIQALSFDPPSSVDSDTASQTSGGVFAFLFMLSTARCIFTNWRGGTVEQLKSAKQVALIRAKQVWDAMSLRMGGIEVADDEENGDDEARMEI